MEAAAKDANLPDISAFIQAAKVSGLLDNVFACERCGPCFLGKLKPAVAFLVDDPLLVL